MGIDYGKKNIGIALSDEECRFAFAHTVVENNKRAIEEIKKIIHKNKVGKIVIGESLDYGGRPNPIMENINAFKKILEKETTLEVVFEPEILTTKEAEREYESGRPRPPTARKQKSGKIEKLDASAAALILKSFIERGEK